MESLCGKNIVLIAPEYFDYEQDIKHKLESFGAHVFLIIENKDASDFIFRFVHFCLRRNGNDMFINYYMKQLKRINVKIDLVFVIRGESLTNEVMDFAKCKFNKAKFIMYQWDGTKNNATALKIAAYFDKVFTFDFADSKKYGWIYRPLFFTQICKDEKKKDIDVLYLCSLHSKRIDILNQLKKLNLKGQFVFYHYLCFYFSKLIFYKWKYINKREPYTNINIEDLKFNQLSRTETYELYRRSKCIVDYTHPGQTGLTMRTIEALGNGCKLITNNQHVKEADFYNPNNILVYDENLENIPREFINSDYEEVDNAIYSKYSLDSWIKDILGDFYEIVEH